MAVLLLFVVPTAGVAVSAQGGTYAGYEVTGPPGQITRVRGSWIVPLVDCEITPNSVLNVSSIIDGINGVHDAMEIGTFSDCVNGVAEYGAFVQFYPTTNGDFDKTLAITVHPGDMVEAQGKWVPLGKPHNVQSWHSSFIDFTTHKKVDTDAVAPVGFVPVASSGAFIVSSDGKKLSSFSTVLSGIDYTKIHNSDVLGLAHTEVYFGLVGEVTGFSIVAFSMPGATPGPISADGSSFAVLEPSAP